MENFRYFNQQLPLIGVVTSKRDDRSAFTVRTRSGTVFEVHMAASTYFSTVQNLDRQQRLRQPLAGDGGADTFDLAVQVDRLIAVDGMYYLHEGQSRYEALSIYGLTSYAGHYHFEHTHWWIAQISAMANKWLDDLFGDKRTYSMDDFSALYRTTLSIQGLPTDDATQEMATLSRLIYGLASAFLMTGDERYYLASKAGVEYQREAFRTISSNGKYCVWLHARKRDKNGRYEVLPSVFGDDLGTIPLYEQIYALAGLAQYYRITNDWEVLHDIRRTVATFEAMFADYREDGTHDGYFSHIDPVTYRWDSPELQRTDNKARKNWNSVGDHLPAYLINLLLALDPLPQVPAGDSGHLGELQAFKAQCEKILQVTSELIREKFPQEGNPYVCERFDRDWHQYYQWGWQQNRAICGHNLKIAWNLTRVAFYYQSRGETEQANRLFATAHRLGVDMGRLGVDQIRSGVYDAVERDPVAGVPTQFAWLDTKDFWQQEQGILAYLIMFGFLHGKDSHSEDAQDFLALGRELCTVWNLYFLDHDRTGVFFRISDNGTPVQGGYGDKGGHSISGYHVFELNYLTHIYLRAFGPQWHREHTVFCLNFRPDVNCGHRSINVLPDYLGADSVEIDGIVVDGIERPVEDPRNFQILLRESDLGQSLVVRFRQTESTFNRLQPLATNSEQSVDVFEAAKI